MQKIFKMNIAIIGAGLAGLAAGWFLSRLGSRVTFFDRRGIGRGASGVAAGLVHPYAGEQTRLSLWAKAACSETKDLVEKISFESILEKGIVRIAQTEIQKRALDHYEDVQFLGDDRYLIRSGMVIDTPSYLQALFKATSSKLICQEIKTFDELDSFDSVLVATGSDAIKLLPRYTPLVSIKKGQVLDVLLEKPMPSTVAKGYLVKGIDRYHWGSTYESNFEHEQPDWEAALAQLEKKRFPFVSAPKVIGCRAGFRLTRRGHYVPVAAKVEKKIWWLGALGSRGLLYHAYLGRKIAEAMWHDDPELLPKECSI
jgi:glycine/D-amino acid oxidase-like deaminating enzyme